MALDTLSRQGQRASDNFLVSGEHVAGFSVRDQFPVVKQYNPVAILFDGAGIVRDKEDCLAAPPE
jgi:hypothetical protein